MEIEKYFSIFGFFHLLSLGNPMFGNILIAFLILFLDIETLVDVLLIQLYMHDKATEFDDMLESQMERMPSMQLFIHPCM